MFLRADPTDVVNCAWYDSPLPPEISIQATIRAAGISRSRPSLPRHRHSHALEEEKTDLTEETRSSVPTLEPKQADLRPRGIRPEGMPLARQLRLRRESHKPWSRSLRRTAQDHRYGARRMGSVWRIPVTALVLRTGRRCHRMPARPSCPRAGRYDFARLGTPRPTDARRQPGRGELRGPRSRLEYRRPRSLQQRALRRKKIAGAAAAKIPPEAECPEGQDFDPIERTCVPTTPEVPPGTAADLGLSKMSVPGCRAPGSCVFHIEVTNHGPNHFEGPLQVTDDKPAGWSFYGGFPAPLWSCTESSNAVTLSGSCRTAARRIDPARSGIHAGATAGRAARGRELCDIVGIGRLHRG